MKLHVSRTYLKIDLDAVLFNLEEMHRHMKQDVKMIAIIKTDGYGHGAIAIARELEAISYVWGYGVATVEEAALLRQANIQKPVDSGLFLSRTVSLYHQRTCETGCIYV